MSRRLPVCVVLAIFIVNGINARDYFFVVAPNAFRLNHDETVVIHQFGSQSRSVTVWLELNNRPFTQPITVAVQSQPFNTTIRVTEEDITDDNNLPAPYVTLVAEYTGQQGQQWRADVMIDYNSGYIIIQTDKPIYSPGQTELPTFGVSVGIAESCILSTTTNIDVKVEGRYVYDKPVKGIYSLDIVLSHDDRTILEQDIILSRVKTKISYSGKYTFNVNMSDVLNSNFKPSSISLFPASGYYLKMMANILELATGNRESGSNTIIFADNQYIFNFDESRQFYVPSYVYTLKARIRLANNTPVATGKVTVNEMLNSLKETVTINDGVIIATISTKNLQANRPLEITLEFEGETSSVYQVMPYNGKTQVNVEKVTAADGNVEQLRVKTNAKSDTHSGFIVMILSKGQIIKTYYYDMKSEEYINMNSDLEEFLSPSARVVVYLVEKNTGDVVSDSTRFKIKQVCRGEKLDLSIKNDKGAFTPGSKTDLQINGEKGMHVGLLAIDEALLLLDDNILKEDTMFQLFEDHDLGCGAGGGGSSYDVFKRAGLMVLSNANIKIEKRQARDCTGMTRKKRSAECHAQSICCEMGYKYGNAIYAENLVYQQHDPERVLDLPSRCYARTLKLAEDLKFTTACVQEFLNYCFLAIEEQDDGLVGKSFGEETDYLRDMKDTDFEIKIRQNFKESWLFDYLNLDRNGEGEKAMAFPSSITTWRIMGLGFSEGNGICIAKSINAVVRKSFFIQLDLPYSAVRMESINIKATVFNYEKSEVQVNIYLEGQDNLCSNTKPNKMSPSQRVTIEANDAKSVNFIVRPLIAKTYDIKVMATARSNGEYIKDDGIMKKLLVVNEGEKKTETVHVCLDPLSQNKACANSKFSESIINEKQIIKIPLRVPHDAIPKTGHATGYISSNLLTNVVDTVFNGTEKLIRLPTGCGEQTLSKLAPLVFAMRYLKQTKQLTSQRERDGYDFITRGKEHMMSYRKEDNAYAIYKSYPPSTWLSAFAMKTFCQANKVRANFVNQQMDILPTLEFLLQQNENGKYKEKSYLNWRYRQDANNGNLLLSAFVSISFLECDGRTDKMNASILQAIDVLAEQPLEWYKQNSYHLAITTYALGMAKSEHRFDFMEALDSISKKDQFGGKYWEDTRSTPGWWWPSNAGTVETTSYALLAYLNFHRDIESAEIVQWLIKQRRGNGAFYSTQDTVVGLQALTEYNIRTYVKDINLKVTMRGDIKNSLRTFTITQENADVMLVIPDIIENGEGNKTIDVEVEGFGSGYLDINFQYFIPSSNERPCSFEVSHIESTLIDNTLEVDSRVSEARNCDVCSCDEPENSTVVQSEDFEEDTETFNRKKRQAKKLPSSQSGTMLENKKIYCIKFTVRSDNSSGMAMVEFGLQTGLTVIKNDIKRLKEENSDVISRYELPKDGSGYVIFYLQSIEPTPINFKFRVEDSFDDDMRQMALVKVYDYYNPDQMCTKAYSVTGTGQNALSYHCKNDKKRRDCVCLQSVCAKDRLKNKKFIHKRQRKQLYTDLRQRICKKHLADYAVIVVIKETGSNNETGYKNATGEITNILHRGHEMVSKQLENGDYMNFRWQSHCDYPNLVKGKTYYIVANDGIKLDEDTWMNELMGSAVVIEKRKNSPVKQPMLSFIKAMKKKGCAT